MATVERFLVRTALTLGAGDWSRAMEDITFLFQLAERPRLNRQAAWHCSQLECDVTRLMIRSLLTIGIPDSETMAQIRQLTEPTPRQNIVNLYKRLRLYSLDGVQRQRDGRLRLSHLVRGNTRLDRWQERRIRGSTDWNRVMRSYNEFFDKCEAALSKPNLHEALREIRSLEPEGSGYSVAAQLKERQLWGEVPSTQEVIDALSTFRSQSADDLEVIMTRNLRRQAVQLVAALAIWKQAHGHFPDQLDDLIDDGSSDSVNENLLIDPFCGAPLKYQRVENGFEFRSVGRNQQPDDRVFLELDCVAFTQPSTNFDKDIVWRWQPDSSAIPVPSDLRSPP